MITPGQQGDITTAPELLEGVEAGCVLADAAYDSNALRALIKAKKAKAVIPSNPTRKKIIRHDKTLYRLRNAIERCINRLKNSRRVATRYDHTAASFLGFILLATIRRRIEFFPTPPRTDAVTHTRLAVLFADRLRSGPDARSSDGDDLRDVILIVVHVETEAYETTPDRKTNPSLIQRICETIELRVAG